MKLQYLSFNTYYQTINQISNNNSINYKPNNKFNITNLHKYQYQPNQSTASAQQPNYNNKLTIINKYILINDVVYNIHSNNSPKSIYTWVSDELVSPISSEINAKIPLFFSHNYTIKIPNKVERLLRRVLPKAVLKEIDDDIEVAIELCLLMLTQLNSTYFELRDGTSIDGWKSLKAEFLRDFLSTGNMTYKKVREALEYPYVTGQIIECDYNATKNLKAYNYRFGKAYISKGLVNYKLKTTKAKELLDKSYLRAHKIACKNPICYNLIKLYSSVTLPSLDEIEAEAHLLIKNKFKTKKGKTLKFLGKHSMSNFKNPEQISFVEDAIKIFNYLTENGLMIPTPGSDKSGGRIVDSFTLMPSWIRSLVRIDGVTFAECDYTCLHPNIAISIYGGSTTYIKHQDIVKTMKLDLATVKKEHLSFFNKPIWQMKQSPLFDFYQKHESIMIDNIIKEKSYSGYAHRSTSRNMFFKEVEIMTDVIEQLNKKEIHVGYVYDALFCNPKHAEIVKHIMDTTAEKHKVKTTAKITYAAPLNTFENLEFNSNNSITGNDLRLLITPFNNQPIFIQ
jgi:hypothetical protein